MHMLYHHQGEVDRNGEARTKNYNKKYVHIAHATNIIVITDVCE